ncbi:oligosaccharide flippase family protein [Nordella sp. HKS 07]|uniref:oligosaccharide flippase family protein n=1 Tax=Nordella sp. HKS 07 TaxID=2712222 RepID=UPI0013E0F307|nr:polysaccharide biosynthesis C-terminal domain-containing protein [Nordella sp. HKS 07]QIG47451.1 oligosaccharide flippase family protein [Nordella sp. HKS 07]
MSSAPTIRGSISIILVRITGAGLALLAQVIASRIIGAEEFGRYSLMLVWLLLLGHGATAGTNPLLCRYIAQYLKSGDMPAIAGLLRWAISVVLAVGTTLGLSAVLLIHTGIIAVGPETILLATLAFSAVPLLVLQDFLEAIARGVDRPALGIAPAYLVRHLAIIFGLLSAFLLGCQAGAVTVMSMTIIGLVISLVIQFILLHHHVAGLLRGTLPVYRQHEWYRTALPMALGEAAELLFMNADILILGMFVGPELIAYYFAATRLAQVLTYVPYGMSAVTAQRMAALAESRERGRLQALIDHTTLVSGGLAILAALGMAVLAPYLLALFGNDYAQAAPLVIILAGGIAFACLLGPGEDTLNMLGQERAGLICIAAALAVNLALNFLLVPRMGPAGAAWASAIALAARGLLAAGFAKRNLNLYLPLGASRLAGT